MTPAAPFESGTRVASRLDHVVGRQLDLLEVSHEES